MNTWRATSAACCSGLLVVGLSLSRAEEPVQGYQWRWVSREARADGSPSLCLYRGTPAPGMLAVPAELGKVDRALLRVEGDTVRLATVSEQAAVTAAKEAVVLAESKTSAREALYSAEARVQAITAALIRAEGASKDCKDLEADLLAAQTAAVNAAKALP